MDAGKNSREERFEITIAILIAVVTVIVGIVAWWASKSDDSAGDFDREGLRAALNAEETKALNSVNAYESYKSFSVYQKYEQLAALISEEQADAPDDETLELLETKRLEAKNLGTAYSFLFSGRFVNKDGSYALSRQMGEMWADAAREKDLNYQAQFSQADQYRTKTVNLLIALLILAVAPVFFSVIESVEGKAKTILAVLGTVTGVAGLILAIIIQTGIIK